MYGLHPDQPGRHLQRSTGKFTAAVPLSQPQAYQSTTLLSTGRALQNGGIGTTATCCIVLGTAQLYTPLTLTFSSSSLNFGLLQTGLTSPSQTVTDTHVSTPPVKFSSIAVSGMFNAVIMAAKPIGKAVNRRTITRITQT